LAKEVPIKKYGRHKNTSRLNFYSFGGIVKTEATIRLFKGVLVESKRRKKITKQLLEKTVSNGFIFSPEVIANYSSDELEYLNIVVTKELCLSPDKMNNSFHKSWKKIRNSSTRQLVLEQMIHYLTTYGFESEGFYDKDLVYIPNEKLEIPELKERVNLIVIKGYTKEELKEKVYQLLYSGIALSEGVIKDLIEVFSIIKLTEKDLLKVKNKEVRILLYDKLNVLPQNQIEFLRYVLYKATNKTLLIKDRSTIEAIKNSKEFSIILHLFTRYHNEYGLHQLAEIFHRFKPLFLAFKHIEHKKNSSLVTIINKIRKLSSTYHKPMEEDYLNSITSMIKHSTTVHKDKLLSELDKVNVFRKIRLAYALKFRTLESDAILYRIRNGKSWAEDFNFEFPNKANSVLNIVLDSIGHDLKGKFKDKKIFIPECINYTLPATEKQFTGYFPTGTYIETPSDMIVGVHWVNDKVIGRVDLDLSMINQDGKIGWDSSYRSKKLDILFSGDMTDAPPPKGASEMVYVEKQDYAVNNIMLNFFNSYPGSETEVPFELFVASEKVSECFDRDYMVDPNNVFTVVKSSIKGIQKMLGMLITTSKNCRFYFVESNIGNSITSKNRKHIENSRKYLANYYRNTISLRDVLVKAGAKLVESKKNCDIDLSPEVLEKDTILKLFY